MKIEKIDNENIKTYIKDLGIEATLDDEKSIVNTNTFGVKEEDKFYFFSSLNKKGIETLIDNLFLEFATDID